MAKRKNPAAVALGKARAKKLGKKRTAEIASAAAKARWADTTKEERQEAMAPANEARRNEKTA